MNTTRWDGRACLMCGDDALDAKLLQGHTHAIALCDPCLDNVATCPQCEQEFWGPEGYRIYASPDLYCASCAAQHPAVVMGREVDARAAEQEQR